MRLTQYTDFALRTLIYLGANGDRKSTIRDIADAYGISKNHLTKVVQHLNRLGFIQTTRGRGGGLALARSSSDINIGDVTRRMEPSNTLVECFDENGQCVIQDCCKLSGALREAHGAFMAALDRYTLADLLHERSNPLRQALAIPLVEISV